MKNNFDMRYVEAQHNEMPKSKNERIISAVVEDLPGMEVA